MRKSEYKTLADFYREYPYKKIHYPTHQPYVSKKDDTDHPMSLTYPVWLKVIKIYYKYVALYLAQGLIYRFSSGIGELKVVKFKSKRKPADYPKIRKMIQKERGCTYEETKKYITSEMAQRYKHLNKDVDGYRWKVGWFRHEYKFKFNRYWSFKLSLMAWKLMNPEIRKNIHKIPFSDWVGRRRIKKTFK